MVPMGPLRVRGRLLGKVEHLPLGALADLEGQLQALAGGA